MSDTREKKRDKRARSAYQRPTLRGPHPLTREVARGLWGDAERDWPPWVQRAVERAERR